MKGYPFATLEAKSRSWLTTLEQSSGPEVVVELAAERAILVNAIRTGCSPQQSALPMLLSADEALKGFVLECRDQGTLACSKALLRKMPIYVILLN